MCIIAINNIELLIKKIQVYHLDCHPLKLIYYFLNFFTFVDPLKGYEVRTVHVQCTPIVILRNFILNCIKCCGLVLNFAKVSKNQDFEKVCQVSDQMTTIGKYFVCKHQVQVNNESLQVCGKFICFHIVKENSFRTLIQCFLIKLFCFHSLFFVTGSQRLM